MAYATSILTVFDSDYSPSLNSQLLRSYNPCHQLAKMFAGKAFVIVAFCLTAALAVTSFKPCEKGPAPLELRVKGCEAEPCVFQRGTNVEAEWDFSVVKDTKDLKPVVMATALGVTVPYYLPEQNACNSLTNGECPLDEGEEVTYSLKMPILKIYPKVSLSLKFSLVDSSNNIHMCFELKAKVVAKA